MEKNKWLIGAGIAGVAGAVIYLITKPDQVEEPILPPEPQIVTVYDSYGTSYTGALISTNPDGSMNVDIDGDGIIDVTGTLIYTPSYSATITAIVDTTIIAYQTFGVVILVTNTGDPTTMFVGHDGIDYITIPTLATGEIRTIDFTFMAGTEPTTMNFEVGRDSQILNSYPLTMTPLPPETWMNLNISRTFKVKLPVGAVVMGSSPAYSNYKWTVSNVASDSWGFYYDGRMWVEAQPLGMTEPLITITQVVKETAFSTINIVSTATASSCEIFDNEHIYYASGSSTTPMPSFSGSLPSSVLIAPGIYTIKYAEVAGYIKPANQTLTVSGVNQIIEVTANYAPTPNVMNAGNSGIFTGTIKSSMLTEVQKKYSSAYFFDDFADGIINTSKWTKTTYSAYNGVPPAALGANGSVSETSSSGGYISVWSGGESLQYYNAYDQASASLSSIGTPGISTVNYIVFRFSIASSTNAGANSSFSLGNYGASFSGVGSIDYVVELIRNGATFDVYRNGVYQNNMNLTATNIYGSSASIFGTTLNIFYVIFG